MTGTGTQTDPYIVMNETDLLNMKGGIDKYYKLGTDINLSERSSNSSPISIEFKEFDGDGHTISNWFKKVSSSTDRNAFFKAWSGTTAKCIFRNLNFKGLYLAGGRTYFIDMKEVPSEGSFEFINCRFSIKINDTQERSGKEPLFQRVFLIDSEVLIEGTSDYTKTITNEEIKGSLIKLNLTYFNNNYTATDYIFGGNLSCCGIIGKITFPNPSYANPGLAGDTTNSYFALEFENLASLRTNSFKGVNFYDKEIMANAVQFMPKVSNLYALTTEQCKSAEYLQSIGFPCRSGDAI